MVHIDTDVAEEKGFDVAHKANGRTREPSDLIAAVIDRLTREMGEEFWRECATRVVFAVAVDSIECWLVPLFSTIN